MTVRHEKDPATWSVLPTLRSAVERGTVRTHVATSTLSRWQIGGAADVAVEPFARDELAAVLKSVSGTEAPVCVVGEGSNLLFDTTGFHGVIIIVGRRFTSVQIDGAAVTAGAGMATPDLAKLVGEAGLTGIEHTVGIPGTLGGLVLMNGGSLRQGIGSHVESVTCLAADGKEFSMSRDECEFAYRSSSLQTLGAVVVEVKLSLDYGNRDEIRSKMQRILDDRAAKFPLTEPSCGSTFVSDPALYETIGPPGKAIEMVGLKGRARGRVKISEQHANFFVNLGGASTDDALWLIALARNRVRAATGVSMKCEVRYVAPDGTICPAHEEAERRWGRDLLE